MSGAAAMRANVAAGFDQARPHALARKFKEPESADPAELNARAIRFDGFLEPFFDGALITRFIHIDEIDDDQTREVAKTKLQSDFAGSFQVCFKGGFLDIALARRPARVYVDCDKRFGLIDDDVAARFQLDDRAVHRLQQTFHLVSVEQRNRVVAVRLNPLGVARHHHPHDFLRRLIGVVALDEHFLDFARIQIADGALDQVAFLVDQCRSRRFQRQGTYFLPQTHKVIEVPLDLGLVPLHARGPHDHAHAIRNFQVLQQVPQPAPVSRVGDFTRYPAAIARRVGHQNAVTSGQRKVGGECCALVAAFFLYDLNQQDLTPFDDFLNLVSPHRVVATVAALSSAA